MVLFITSRYLTVYVHFSRSLVIAGLVHKSRFFLKRNGLVRYMQAAYLAILTVAIAGCAIASDLPEGCMLSGHIRDALSGQLVPHASVSLEPIDLPEASFESSALAFIAPNSTPPHALAMAKSNGDGFYCISSATPGTYVLAADKQGFVEAKFGASAMMASGRPITIPIDGNAPYDLALFPRGVLSGKVVDGDGEPVISAKVTAISRVWVMGKLHSVVTRSSTTNDLGEFRLAGLAPGKYFLYAEGPIERGVPNVPTADQFVPVFYPNAQALTQSTPIEVQAGQDIPNIAIELRKGPRFHVRGHVVGEFSGDGSASLSLHPADQEETFLAIAGGGVQKDGTFDFSEVAPGAYKLTYFSFSGGMVKAAKQHVEITDHDINGIQLNVLPSARVQARIIVEGAPADPSARSEMSSLNLMLVESGELVAPAFKGKYLGNNMFEFAGVLPGKYELHAGSFKGAYLKSIRNNARDAANAEIDLSGGGAVALELTYHYGASGISGTIEASSGTPSTKTAHLLVIPMTPGRQSMKPVFGNLDQSQHFAINDLTPGIYKVVALEEVDYLALQDPAKLQLIGSLGSTVVVKEDEMQEIQVKLHSSADVVVALRH